MAKFLKDLSSNWHHYFDNLTISPNEFYSLVETAVKARKIPDVKIERVKLSQAGIFSADREYLRVTRKGQSFDVCAAPFARGFFVSWWLGQEDALLGNVFNSRKLRTYFQVDTEAMYKEAVIGAVMEAVDNLINSKSLKALTELERSSQNMSMASI